VTKYFEIISASSPHIYHSALVVAPKESIVWKLYKPHAHSFMRVVWGAPISWDTNIAAVTRPSEIELAVWSPCNRFIAITWEGARVVDVLDSATLQQLQTFRPPQDIPINERDLAFSPDSHILTCSSHLGFQCSEVHIVSWDLQTGGVVSVIRHQYEFYPSVGKSDLIYSENGKMIGLSYSYDIFMVTIFNVASGIHIHSHSIDIGILNIWAQGESLRFATHDGTTIVIWEVGFTSDTAPTKVMAFPTPGDERDEQTLYRLAHPHSNPSQLIIDTRRRVQIWDAWDSELLLNHDTNVIDTPSSFSSNGGFFACSTRGLGVTLWKVSPTGYILHKKLTPNTTHSGVHLSQDGKSIIVVTGHMIQLWYTEGFTATPLAQGSQRTKNFPLIFSPNGTVVALAMKDNTVVVFDLKSGVPQLTIDTGMNVLGLGVIGDKVFVIDNQRVVAWNLPTRYYSSTARVTLKDGSQTVDFSMYEDLYIVSASISPNSHLIALIVCTPYTFLCIHNVYTGEVSLGGTTIGNILWFSPDGNNIWSAWDRGGVEVWKVTDELHKSGYLTVGIDPPPEGSPWVSSCGYQITKDCWVLGPGGKRLLMLPPPWQTYAVRQIWKGQFLALLHCTQLEPVILDFNP